VRSALETEHVPVTFHVDDLKQVDAWQAAQGAPPAVATLIDVALDPENAGAWSTLPDGERIWQLNLRAEGALALMLYYSDFHIPEGGKLFIYNAEKTQVLGAYTHRTYPSGGRFATEFVAGDELTLEYVASPDDATLRLKIEAVGYGYNHLTVRENTVSLRASASCEVNINCEEGDMWQRQKKGVCRTVQRVNSKSYLCSASLLNNTAQDLTPYILTAQHCSSDGAVDATEEEMKQWMFYFQYEFSECSNQSALMPNKTMTGCTRIASTATHKESDGLLLRIDMAIPEEYNVYYNGWDRRDKPAYSGVGIHCPAGDYTKISTFRDPAISYTFRADDNTTGDTNAHWNAIFDETLNGHGVSEKGSSGSPLFNENQLVVGTLTGGNSSCYYPNGLNLYGKLSYHWDKYKSPMARWLDPVDSGAETLNGRYHAGEMVAPVHLSVSYQHKIARLTWDIPSSESPLKYRIYDNDIKIGETMAQSYTDEAPTADVHTYSVSAVYTGDRESGPVHATLVIPEYKAPVNVSAVHTVSRKIAVLWDPPLYEQTIYWGGARVMYQVGMDDNTPFYFGQLWTKDEIRSFHRKTLSSVRFMPIRNNTYEIHIVQGNRIYDQKVVSQVVETTLTVPLTTPFVIDGTQDLIVSIYAAQSSGRESEYPAACDAGPAIRGKGDVYSSDAETWFSLYDENEADKNLDMNFFVAATVTSDEGDLPTEIHAGVQQQPIVSNAGSNHLRIRSASLSSDKVSLYSFEPVAFPEITGYVIYRNQAKLATVATSPRRYVDLNPLVTNSYQIAALFGNDEGTPSASTDVISPVGNMDVGDAGIALYPGSFGAQVEIKGVDRIARVEVYAADGKQCLRVENPDKVISTQSLPAGLYFFRIYPYSGTPKVLRGVKLQ
jgi:predicted Rdx family selenoprotein